MFGRGVKAKKYLALLPLVYRVKTVYIKETGSHFVQCTLKGLDFLYALMGPVNKVKGHLLNIICILSLSFSVCLMKESVN